MSINIDILASFLLGTSLGMPVLAEDSLMSQQECIPSVSISDNVVDNTIRVQVAEGNTCPIATRIYLFIQDDGRPQPLKLPGFRENFMSSTWVVRPDGARPGQYRVMGINPTPNGIGDNEYISARHLRIDQVITVGGTQGKEQSAPTPSLVVPQPLVHSQQVTTLDPESKQLLINFNQSMRWLQVQMDWLRANLPRLELLIRAIESI